MSPPVNTLAIVINVGKEKATLIIWEKATGNGVTRVGTEEEEKIVMIEWDNDWEFTVLVDSEQHLRLGYIGR